MSEVAIPHISFYDTELSFEEHATNQCVRADGEVGSFARRRIEIPRRAHAHAADLVHRVRAEAGEIVRGCLDWTEQREHIAGPVGKALLTRLLELEWIADAPATRAVRITDLGRAGLRDRLGVQLPT